jgi:hypothetical protein
VKTYHVLALYGSLRRHGLDNFTKWLFPHSPILHGCHKLWKGFSFWWLHSFTFQPLKNKYANTIKRIKRSTHCTKTDQKGKLSFLLWSRRTSWFHGNLSSSITSDDPS